MSIVTLERKILESNDEIARRNREYLKDMGIFTLNVVSSPGAGKTTLLEQTIERLKGHVGIAVVEGDVQTNLDAQRVERYGVPVAQIVTNGGCHLDAGLVEQAIHKLDLNGVEILFIENVGNLVCPANYDLGEDMKVVVASVTDGDDKPLKYPAMFRNSSVLIVNKIDLLPHLKVSVAELRHNAALINPSLEVFEVSATGGMGFDPWCYWLLKQTGVPVWESGFVWPSKERFKASGSGHSSIDLQHTSVSQDG